MNGMTPLRFARNALLSSFIGATAAVTINCWRRDNHRPKQLLLYSAVAGTCGLGVGYTMASLKRRDVYFHGVNFGGNFFIVTGTFFVFRDIILAQFGKGGRKIFTYKAPGPNINLLDQHTVSPMLASAVSGGLTGFILTSVFSRGLPAIASTSIQGIGLAVLGQFVYDTYTVWRLEKVLEYNYPQLTGNVSKVQQDVLSEEKLHWSESIQNFLTTKTYSSQVNDQIRQLEIQLEMLKEEENKLQSILKSEESNIEKHHDEIEQDS